MRGTREDVFRGSLRAVALLKGGMAILSGPRCRTAFIALLFRIITTLPNCLALPDRMPSGFVSRSWSFASQASRLVGKTTPLQEVGPGSHIRVRLRRCHMISR